MTHTGSSAGSGSGDCHHYLQGRRAEIFRLEALQAKSEKDKLDKEWKDDLETRKAEAEAERAKKAEKRNKKKQKRTNPATDDDNVKKQKLEEATKNEIHNTSSLPTEEEIKEDLSKADEEPKAKIKQVTGILLSDD